MARKTYWHHWFGVGDNISVKVNHPVYKTLAVNVMYTKGGPDMLCGGHDIRGYYLTICPLDAHGRHDPNDSFKALLKAVSRRSDKADDAATIKENYAMPMAIADVCDKIGATCDLSTLGGAV